MAGRSPRGTRSPTAKEVAHAAAVRAEKTESDMKAVLEAVTGMRQELGGQIRALDEKLSRQITDLQDVVRMNSVDIRQNSADIHQNSADIRQNSADIHQNSADIRQNSQDILALRVEITALRHDFDHRAERTG